MIYKILRGNEYLELSEKGISQGAPIDVQDGYIHFSTASQVAETLSKHFSGEAGLWLLTYDETELENLKWEPSRGGDLFPHLYAPLELAGAKSVVKLEANQLPKGFKNA